MKIFISCTHEMKSITNVAVTLVHQSASGAKEHDEYWKKGSDLMNWKNYNSLPIYITSGFYPKASCILWGGCWKECWEM